MLLFQGWGEGWAKKRKEYVTCYEMEEAVTKVCPCCQRDRRRWGTAVTATACRDPHNSNCFTCPYPPSSRSCHHSSKQFGTGKVGMAGPKCEQFVLASHAIRKGTSRCGRAHPHNIICHTQNCISGWAVDAQHPDIQRLYSQLNCSALRAANPSPLDVEHSLTVCQGVQGVDHELEDGAAHLSVV